MANMDLAFGNLSSPGPSSDHSLCSPDLSSFTISPQSTFMYEHDEEHDRGKAESVFEFSRPMEGNDLSGELNSSFWGEESLLETSFADSCKASMWDFAGFDDISSPLQHPEDDLSYTPTLAELNNDDSQSFDAMLSSHNACIGSVSPKKRVCLNNNVSSKLQCSVSGPACDVAPDIPRSRDRETSSDHEPLNLLDCPSIKTHSPPLSSKIGVRTNRENDLKTVDRLTIKTTSSVHPHQHPVKLTRKAMGLCRFDPGISKVVVSQRKGKMDQKWQELQSYIREEDSDQLMAERTGSVHRTMNSPDEKRMITSMIKDEFDGTMVHTGGTDGYDSHDEGLGSEHEDQDDDEEDDMLEGDGRDGLSDVEDEDDDDDDDACSDMSEDHGVATTSSSQDLFPTKVKSRRSEYDDLTPNPKRLLLIGNELHKLNKIISGMIPVSALPVSARNRSRKEKNKLASRACRLKKKAQHEANKVKLFGLEKEYDRLMQVITAIRREILVYLQQRPRESTSLSDKLNTLIKNILGQMVAFHTQEFVSTVLEKTGNGSKLSAGGLSFLTNRD